MAVKTKRPVLGDLVKWEVHQLHTRENFKITTPTDTAINIAEMLGVPLKASGANLVPVAAADIANATHLLAEVGALSIESNGTTTRTYQVIARGPATINKDFLPASDFAAAGYNAANFVARLKALGYSILSEPVEIETQTS